MDQKRKAGGEGGEFKMDDEMPYANRPVGYDGAQVFFHLDREKPLEKNGGARYLWNIPLAGLSGRIVAKHGRDLDFSEMAERIRQENVEALEGN